MSIILMFVKKRNGTSEPIYFDKITQRITNLINTNENKFIDPVIIAQKTIISIFNGITTEELDLESANVAINLCTTHYLYSLLAGKILISNLHKKTETTFVEKEEFIQNKLNLLDDKWLEWIKNNRKEINNMINYNNDYIYDYFGFKTLERSYLLKNGKDVIERPQDMLMRVASFINQNDLEMTKKTYNLISNGYYTHASPTLFNAANKKSQLSSCFLLGTDDSLDCITKTWSDVAQISKWGGGIGLHVSNIRASESLIRGTNGPSSGIIPMLKVYNEIARYIDQCFIGDTKIFTEKGLIQIDSIVPKDKVYTIDGSLQEVCRVYCDKYDGKIIEIKLIGYTKIVKVTEKHPFYTIKLSEKIPLNLLKEKLDRHLVIPDWIPVNEIEDNDFVCIPIPSYIDDNLNLDESDCYIYGLMMVNFINKNNKMGILKYEYNKDCIINYLKLYGIKYIVTDDNIHWDLTSKFKFTLSQMYNPDYNLLNLPINKLKYILKGIIDSKNKLININSIIINKFHDKSHYEFLEILLLKLGILILNDDVAQKYISIGKNKIISELYNTNESNELHYLVHNNNIFTNLVKINETNVTTCVYDLEIKNNHNYLTEVGLVHNGGKRKGSIAIYLEPHHPDIMAFLDLKKNFGAETERARDLFLAVWLSDLFMKQVESDGDWYLMCPDKCKGLSDVYGKEYENLYWSYVKSEKYNKKIKARDIMKAILDSQLETGTPYIGFKDNINHKSNQKNIGVIKSSNLCVHGDTLLLTNNGNLQISSLKDQQVTIWNGFEWSDVVIKQTGIDCPLIRIIVTPYKNNKELPIRVLDCTMTHKFYVDNSNNIVDAQNLKLGNKLIGYNNSNLNELLLENYDYAEIVGLQDCKMKGNTYCLTEPKKHMAIFNGILTGQCIEIVEYSDATEYAVCNLASIAINKCVNKFIFNNTDKWIIYTKENCKYCNWAKMFLLNNSANFEEIPNELPINKYTYPQIYHNNKYVGGFDQLYDYTKATFDYDKLYDIAYIAAVNLNKIIDINFYPVIEAKKSNLKHRPIGLGIQGLADALVLMKIPFDSDESVTFNANMMETIYLAAVTASIDESKNRYYILKDYIKNTNVNDFPEYYDPTYNIHDTVYHKLKLNKFEVINKISGAYSTFDGSPTSQGKFQFDLWNLDRNLLMYKNKWEILTEKVKKYGIRNSLLTALMPTASTSQILGNNECFEFFTNNIYSRRTLSGNFPLVNKYLIDDLYNLGLWSNDMKQLILANNGSIANFNNIPDQIKALYKTIWEIKQVYVLKNAIARGPFNDQTQSMNIFMQVPDYQKLYSSHFYAWKNGLKTGIYYLRTKPAKDAVKITIDPTVSKKLEEITSNDDNNICESCSA